MGKAGFLNSFFPFGATELFRLKARAPAVADRRSAVCFCGGTMCAFSRDSDLCGGIRDLVIATPVIVSRFLSDKWCGGRFAVVLGFAGCERCRSSDYVVLLGFNCMIDLAMVCARL